MLIIQALEQMDILFVIRIRLKFTFETLFAHIKGIQTTFKRSPNIQDGGKKRYAGQNLKFDLKVKATVLSLLSYIFVMLESRRLR